jgi:hypothetical protein
VVKIKIWFICMDIEEIKIAEEDMYFTCGEDYFTSY